MILQTENDRKHRQVYVKFRATDEERERINALAEREGISVSELLRRAVNSYASASNEDN